MIRNFFYYMEVAIMTKRRVAVLSLCFVLLPVITYAQQNSLAIGYGFGAFNDKAPPKLQSDDYYRYIHIVYGYERQMFSPHIQLLLEPYVDYVMKPHDGLDVGLGVSLKFYPFNEKRKGLFFVAGTGAAYTTIGFKEQGTHAPFILQGGVGYQWDRIFIENRFRHYSNAGLASPNHSINSNIFLIGTRF
jgi:hypothetical protein